MLLVSFSSDDKLSWKLARLRFERQARRFDFPVKVYTPRDIPELESLGLSSSWVKDNPKGYGLWFWKPVLIENLLEKLISQETSDFDYVVYADIGCEIWDSPYGRERLREWLTLAEAASGLFFQLNHIEANYTSPKTIQALEKPHSGTNFMYHSNQIMATIFFLKVDAKSLNFCRLWTSGCLKLNGLALRLGEEFENHRHDQSVMSLVIKNLNQFWITPDETYLEELRYPQIPSIVSARRKGLFSAVSAKFLDKWKNLLRLEVLFYAALDKALRGMKFLS